MAWFIALDAGPLSTACSTPSRLNTMQFLAWAARIRAAGGHLVVPEISDYEVRRELLRIGAMSSLTRLDDLRVTMTQEPISTEAMRLAAELWAQVRNVGLPTAHPHALDGDVILAAQAKLLAGPADRVTVATSNAAHLGRFLDARDRTAIS